MSHPVFFLAKRPFLPNQFGFCQNARRSFGKNAKTSWSSGTNFTSRKCPWKGSKCKIFALRARKPPKTSKNAYEHVICEKNFQILTNPGPFLGHSGDQPKVGNFCQNRLGAFGIFAKGGSAKKKRCHKHRHQIKVPCAQNVVCGMLK